MQVIEEMNALRQARQDLQEKMRMVIAENSALKSLRESMAVPSAATSAGSAATLDDSSSATIAKVWSCCRVVCRCTDSWTVTP